MHFVDDAGKKADELLILKASIESIKNRIKEQHSTILESDVLLSDMPLIPTPEEMVEAYAYQEAFKEVMDKLGGIIYR